MQFTNMWGLYALLSLIPLIIIYLIKPKPIEKVIPSLMFIMEEKKLTKRQTFFRRFVQNIIFYLQFLALAGLALAIASPYIIMPFTTSSENTVIIIDGSASMQASYGIGTRFDTALSRAKESLDGKISIILAENVPSALLTKGSKSDALSVLGKISPKATTSNIGDALLMANDILGTEKGKVVVLSDFIPTEGADIMVAKSRLESAEHVVEFRDLSGDSDNVGIIALSVSKITTKVTVKNFNKDAIKSDIEILRDSKKLDSASVSIEPDSVEEFTFATPQGKSEIILDRKDDFMLDNKVSISNPFNQKVKVLLVSNLKENNYVQAVMEAIPDVSLDVRRPPTINPENLNHDIVIINDVDKNLLVPGDFNLISKYAKGGSSVIVMPQNDLGAIDMSDILPFPLGTKQQSTQVCVQIVNRFTKNLGDGCFTKSPYFNVTAQNGTTAIAKTDSEVPIIVMKEHGSGKAVYYGIFDRESDFKSTSEYPIFWAELIGFLSGAEDIGNFNVHTGEIIPVAEQEVSTPGATLKTNRIYFDETGFYSYSGREIASNLISEKESNVGAINMLKSGKESIAGSAEEASEREVSLDLPLLALIALLLIAELLIVKFRGDA